MQRAAVFGEGVGTNKKERSASLTRPECEDVFYLIKSRIKIRKEVDFIARVTQIK